MTKFIILSACFLVSVVVRAQDFSLNGAEKRYVTTTVEEQDGRLVRTYYNSIYKKAELTGKYLAAREELDQNENVTARHSYNRKGKLKSSNFYTIDDKGRTISEMRFVKNKLDYKTERVFDEQGNLTEQISYRTNLFEPDWRYVFTYNGDGKVLEKKMICRKAEDNLKWEYSYYPEGSLKSAVQYDHQGRIVNYSEVSAAK